MLDAVVARSTSESDNRPALRHRAVGLRRGFQPEQAGYVRIRYVGVDLVRLEGSWRSLVATGRHEMTGSKQIHAALNVSDGTATRYRRVFAALDLVTNVPGIYVPDDFDGDTVNCPALLRLHSTNPEAFTARMATLTRGLPVRLYVARSWPETAGDDQAVARFARGSESQEEFCVPGPRALVSARAMKKYLVGEGQVAWRETSDTLVPLLLVNVAGATDALATERSEERSSDRLLSQAPDGWSVPELASHLGLSRATTNRRIREWLSQGAVVRVRRGRYVAVDNGTSG